MYNQETRQEALRLRIEEQLSLKDIAAKLGISKATASKWLKEHPLPEKIVRRRMSENGKVSGNPQKKRGPRSTMHKMAADSEINYTRLQKGKIAEAATVLRLVIQGFEVYSSAFDGDKFDWVVASPSGDLLKVQVKWASPQKDGLPLIRLQCADSARSYRRYEEGEFDFIVGYDLYTDTCYVWSWEEVSHLTSSVTICPEAAERWDKMRP